MKLLVYITTIALGGLIIGIDTGIVASVLSMPEFKAFMFPPGTANASSLVGAIVSLGAAGGAFGNLIAGFVLEKLGRRSSLVLSTIFTIVGAVLQTASTGVALMIAGRALGGIALGMLRPTVPTYITELAPAARRGRLVGVFGLLIALGYVIAGWVGYACSFASGNTGWRLALGMQVPCAAVLVLLAVFLPESPRWLAQKERYEDMKRSMQRIHGAGSDSDASIEESLAAIRTQIALEAATRTTHSWGYAMIELFNRRNIVRTAVAIIVLQVGSLSGTMVIQQYQSILYASLGYTGQKALLITGCYGFMGFAGQILNIIGIADRWPRVRTMWFGCIALAICLSILMALSRFYGDGTNETGARTGVAFVFIFSLVFALFFNSTLHTIPPEYFPVHLRGYGLAVADFAQGVTNIWLNQVTPSAFDAIHWKFYSVFIACLLSLAVFYATCLKETNQVPLEEIAARFGDETVVNGDVERKVAAMGGVVAVHLENVPVHGQREQREDDILGPPAAAAARIQV
ncbi:general substrate transporter [Aspergillus pseudoustus]|uniref:General substrate transporter n=1 Tax=Aspergillus pseudoustus TaxID=1810923 RepID=A0ABR4ILC1_9EURO